LTLGDLNSKQRCGLLARADSTTIGGYISENTTWTPGNSPYIVEENVIVEADVFLKIEPGVVVRFANATALIVDGVLIAQGNITSPIIFTSNATTPQNGDWGGIHFRDTSIDDVCTIDWAVVEYADVGITTDSSSPTITNSKMQYNNNGVTMFTATLQIFNCTFANNTQGIFVNGPGSETIHFEIHNSLFENNSVGVIGRGSVEVTEIDIFNTQFSKNGIGIEGHGIGHILNVENSTFLGNQYGVWSEKTMFYLGHVKATLSTFTDNDVAIVDDGVQLLGCNVTNNNIGVFAYNGAWIRKSRISYNNGTGVEASSVIIQNSSVRGNLQNGVVTYTSGTIHFSNLVDNSPYDVFYGGAYGTEVNATDNCWGTTNSTEIAEQIFDYYDDFNYGKVLYEPFADSEFPILPVLHDLVLGNFTVIPRILNEYNNANLTLFVINDGDFEEQWNLTIKVGSHPIINATGNLGMDQNTTHGYDWHWDIHAGEVPPGNHTLIALVAGVPDENDATDNTLTTWIILTIAGDVNGDLTVDIYDAILLAGAYNSVPTSPNWNPNADINGDIIVDIYDAIILANHYNQHYP
jgi:hypothetical protein